MLLEVEHGEFYYRRESPILHDISFYLDSGDIMAVMGQNGIGKTTLIKCIAAILKWTNGHSIVAGQKSDSNKPIQEIGYVPQAHQSSFSYSVRDMVVFGRVGHHSYFASPHEADYIEVDKTLKRVGIEHLAKKQCNELSGGQLQLAFIARALVNSPKLLILDEPESHLDFRNQLRLLKLIENVVQEEKIACIINTHYPNHATRIANKCFLLGEHDYKMGQTKEIMTQENIGKYFSVKSQIVTSKYKGKEMKTFVFLEEV